MLLIDDGSVIEGITSPLDGQVAIPLTDGATLQKWNIYLWDGDLNQWVDQTRPVHTHSSDDDGGTLTNIQTANAGINWSLDETDLIFDVTSGSPTLDNQISGSDGYRRINTGGTTNNGGTYVAAGLRYDFAFDLYAQFRATMSTVTTNYVTRAGFNMEYATASSGAAKKLGIEACSTCNGANIRVVSADGTTRSASNTSHAASTAAVYKLIYDQSTPNLTYTRDGGGTVVKTSNMFSSGTPDRSNVFVFGVKTENTTAKEARLWGLKAYGTMSSESGAWT